MLIILKKYTLILNTGCSTFLKEFIFNSSDFPAECKTAKVSKKTQGIRRETRLCLIINSRNLSGKKQILKPNFQNTSLL
jgi:hypothetical protein